MILLANELRALGDAHRDTTKYIAVAEGAPITGQEAPFDSPAGVDRQRARELRKLAEKMETETDPAEDHFLSAIYRDLSNAKLTAVKVRVCEECLEMARRLVGDQNVTWHSVTGSNCQARIRRLAAGHEYKCTRVIDKADNNKLVPACEGCIKFTETIGVEAAPIELALGRCEINQIIESAHEAEEDK